MRALLLVSALALLPACHTQTARPALHQPGAEKVLLRYKFREGHVDRYAFRITITTRDPKETPARDHTKVVGTATNILSIAKVTPDGSATITGTLQGLKMTGDDQPRDSVTTFSLSPLGRAILPERPVPNAAGPRRKTISPESIARIGAMLPQEKVGIGSTWESSMVEPFSGRGTVPVKSTLFRFEPIDGIGTARIHQVISLPFEMKVDAGGSSQNKPAPAAHLVGSMKINSTIHFSPDLGKVIRTNVLGTAALKLTTTGGDARKTPTSSRLLLVLDVSMDLLK